MPRQENFEHIDKGKIVLNRAQNDGDDNNFIAPETQIMINNEFTDFNNKFGLYIPLHDNTWPKEWMPKLPWNIRPYKKIFSWTQ